jgi:cysteinyl-tRNA synthetase
MHHHYRSGFEWHDTDIQDGTALLRRLVAAAPRDARPDPTELAARGRDAIDDDLDAPKALEALAELADAILSGGSDPAAPDALRGLSKLLGINLTVPVSTYSPG